MKKTKELPTSVPELQAIVLAQNEEIARLHARYIDALEQFKLAQQRRFARSSESNVLQLQLDLQFDEADAVPVEELPTEDNTITVTYTRSKPKRRRD
jgi:transposase